MAFDTLRKQFTREHFWYIEIDIDGTIYRFCENRSPIPIGLEVTEASLKSVRVSPAEIDLNGGFGVRAKASITIAESLDYSVWGTVASPVRFWSRWRAENPYYLGQRISVFSGYIPEDNIYNSADYVQRDYVIESFAQIASGVSIVGKDPLKLASDERSKAPIESRGSLSADLLAASTSFTLQPTGIGDSEYPSADGIIRIGDEVMTYTTRTGDAVSGVTRGQYNTVAVDHGQDDLVQLCLEYDADTVSNIVYDLLTVYAGVATSYINKAEWDAEVSNSFTTTYSTLITEPTGVQSLIKEFAQSAPHYLYWDERVNKIQLIALKPPPEDAPLLTYTENLIKDKTAVKDMQEMRVSTVLVNYGIYDYTKDLDESSNYRNTYVREDSDSVTNYGQRVYRKINSRWISSDNKTAAVLMSARIGRRFSEAPRMIAMELDAKDADVWTGDSVKIQTDLIEQSGGGYPSLFYQIISAGEGENYSYTALEHTYGDPVAGDEDVEDPNVRLIYISGNQDQLKDTLGNARSLRELYEDVYGATPPDAAFDVRFIFESNCVAGSSDNTLYAVKTGAWPELTTPILIINYGLIVGKGGDGSVTGTATNGGPAILLEDDVRINNLNIIGGGGGGGGGAYDTDGSNEAVVGGGGGAGYVNGLANNALVGTQILVQSDGTNTLGGSEGSARGSAPGVFARSGSGGDLGSAGSNGVTGTTLGTGGTAGKAIELNGFSITYVNEGTISGVVS